MPKKSKKHRKHKHKHEKKRKKHTKRDSDSDSVSSGSESSTTYSSSEEEWVEKKKHGSNANRHDEWMSETSFVPSYSLQDIRKKRAEDKKSETERNIQEKAGRCGPELNPYWKDGGTGLPENRNDDGKPKLLSHTVGDQGVKWLKKALLRAEQQAREENRSLESVAAERYGSLRNLYDMIEEAERRNSNSKYGWKHRPTDRSRDRDHGSRPSSSHSSSRFLKPSDDTDKDHLPSSSSSTQSHQGWRKRKKDVELASKKSEIISGPSSDAPVVSKTEQTILTDEEMNSLAAKIVKAEIMGNKSLIQELKQKLEDARKIRDAAKQSSSISKENVVILTETNARGFTQPVRGRTDRSEVKKQKKYQTHADGERVRYFEDDDKYSLTQMFEKEQMTSAADANAEFIRLSSKSKGDKDYAIDDLFMEQSTSNKSKKDKEMQITIDKQRKKERSLESCSWCLMNNKMQKHLIISTGSKVYLALPYFQSLTENHCLIAPIYHTTCSTLVDEDVWEEILDICKKLVNIFREEEMDVIFFETAMNFKSYPHMIIHCVPLPFETSNLAPIYFKKAILECEQEWAQNKKLVNINKMNIKRAIPKGLPYFAVNFALDDGFAHVIEDEKYFPRNFAQEIIGGMLDLDHSTWRKSRPDDFETQCKKVNKFRQVWKF